MTLVFVAMFGLIFGSFLNVCIYRLPRSQSIVMPRSHCVKCNHLIPWYENIPVLSYIILLGKCSVCKNKISIVYPIVEILTAVMSVLLYVFFGPSIKCAVYFVVFSSLIVATFIDFERQEIPDVITLPGIVLGLLTVSIYPELLGKGRLEAITDSFIGILVGGGSLYAIGFLGEIVFKKEAMGGGDIKLLAMVGAFLGWELALITFFLAPIFGSLAGIIAKVKEGKELIPYGPYLSLAAFIALLWGKNILNFMFPY